MTFADNFTFLVNARKENFGKTQTNRSLQTSTVAPIQITHLLAI